MGQANRSNWPAIILLVMVGVSAALEFAKVSVVFDAVAEHYDASDAVAAWFVSLPAVATIVFGLTGSVIAERLGFRRALVGSLVFAVIFSAIQATLPALPIFLGLRLLDGFVQLGIVIAGPVLILEFAQPRARALAMALWGSFFGCAFALAGWTGPMLLDQLGLPGVFGAHAAFAAILLVAVLVWLPRVSVDRPRTGAAPLGFVRAHLETYRLPRAVLPGAVFIFHTALYAVFVLFIPTFVDPAVAPVLLIWMPLTSIFSTIAAGYLTGRFASPPVVLMFGYVGLVASLIAITMTAQLPAFTLVFPLVLMAFSGLIQGASFSLMPALSTDPDVTARSNGVLMQLGNLGTLLGPPVFAAVIAVIPIAGVVSFAGLATVLCAGGIVVSAVALRLTGRRPVTA